jgi:hypothetical protein
LVAALSAGKGDLVLVDKKENLMSKLNLISELNLSFTTISEQELHDNFDSIFRKVQDGVTFAIISKGKVLGYIKPHVPKNKTRTATPKASSKKRDSAGK